MNDDKHCIVRYLFCIQSILLYMASLVPPFYNHIYHLKNYRPVSGLNFISKVTEHVVAKQLKSHLSRNNMDNINQSAYKSGHSTETALLKIKNDIHLNLSKGRPTALVLLDLSAAFDTIDHLQLTERLSSWFSLS